MQVEDAIFHVLNLLIVESSFAERSQSTREGSSEESGTDREDSACSFVRSLPDHVDVIESHVNPVKEK
jgi:hypothetical protein